MTLLPIASTRETLRSTGALLVRHPWRCAAAVAALAAGVGIAMAGPWLVGAMVDAIDGETARFWTLAVLLAVSAILAALIGWAGRVLLAGVTRRAVRSLRETAFAAALSQPSGVLEAAGSGDLIGRLSGDVRAIGAVVSTALPAFLTALFTAVLSVVGLGVLDWRLAVAALVAMPLQVFSLRSFLRRSGPVYRRHRAAQAQRGQQLIETVRGADTVRALRTEVDHLQQLSQRSEQAIGLELRATSLRNTFYGRLNVAEFLGLAAVLGAGFLLVRSGTITLGAATAAALYYLGLFNPIGTLLGTVDDLQDAGASLARLFGLTSLPTPPTDHQATGPGSIELQEVRFGYRPGTTDLDDVSLTIPAGQRVAIVGESGAGKSTLAKMTVGLFRPETGRVCWDGSELGGPAAVAMVSQETHVFAGTVRDDLTLFARRADLTVQEVVEKYGADWIFRLPDGLDTPVGAGGHPLTAGQTQHLALLRLALTDCPVVVLDEATAEAGSDDADLLDTTADLVTRGRTALVIAHRLSQAIVADRVLVMSAGRIIEDGPPSLLLEVGGPFARLLSPQVPPSSRTNPVS